MKNSFELEIAELEGAFDIWFTELREKLKLPGSGDDSIYRLARAAWAKGLGMAAEQFKREAGL